VSVHSGDDLDNRHMPGMPYPGRLPADAVPRDGVWMRCRALDEPDRRAHRTARAPPLLFWWWFVAHGAMNHHQNEGSGRAEGLVQVAHQIAGGLETDRQPDERGIDRER
jgi:hypothetical protein